MRHAYGSRAAAYEHIGNFEKALVDHDIAVAFFEVEDAISKENGTQMAQEKRKARDAFLARAKCKTTMGRPDAAKMDDQRAAALDREAKLLDDQPPSQPRETARNEPRIKLTNSRTGPVTVVIGEDMYRLNAGQTRDLPLFERRQGSPVNIEVRAGTQRLSRSVKAFESWTIR
jgi:hypothetical protein